MDVTWQVNELEKVVEQQQQLLKGQQQALEQLQQKLDISQPRPSLQRSSTMRLPAPDAAPAVVRPFDAQRRAAYGDRRALGLFDARFHSTAGYGGTSGFKGGSWIRECCFMGLSDARRASPAGVPPPGTSGFFRARSSW